MYTCRCCIGLGERQWQISEMKREESIRAESRLSEMKSMDGNSSSSGVTSVGRKASTDV